MKNRWCYRNTTSLAALVACSMAASAAQAQQPVTPPITSQATTTPPADPNDPTPQVEPNATSPTATSVAGDDVVVTGSFIPRNPTVSATVFDRDQLLREGNPTFDILIDRNPLQFGGYNKSDQNFLGGDITATKSVNLRGLYRTLALFNGRRLLTAGGVSNAGISPVDVAILPQIALQRIDTLRSGGSTLYGSDAIAGVWNFISRDRFEGVEVQADHQYYDGGGETTLGIIVGAQSERVRWTAAFEYFNAQTLAIPERRQLVRYGNPATGGWNIGFSSTSFPGVVATSPAGANARYDPVCGASSPNNPLITTWRAGTAAAPVCQWSFVGYNNFVDPEERYKVFSQVSADLTDNVEAYGSILWSSSKATWNTVPFFGATNAGANDSSGYFFIPRDNPGYNAFVAALPAADRALYDPGVTYQGRQGLWLRARPDILTEPRKAGPREREWTMGVFGVRGSLPFDLGFLRNLNYDLSGMFQRRHAYIESPDGLSDRYKLALQGLGGPACRPVSPDPFSPLNNGLRNNAAAGCYAWNPFGNAAAAATGSAEDNRADVRQWFLGRSSGDLQATYTVFDALIRGETSFSLPGGPIAFALGGQSLYFRERTRYPGDNGYDVPPASAPLHFLGVNTPKQFVTTTRRRSVFLELAVPVLDTLDLQLAVRREDYRINAQTAPRLAAAFHPAEWLTLRAGYERAFSIPTASFENVRLESFLPLGQNDFLPRTIRFGTNVSPEQSNNYELGVNIKPIAGLSFDVNLYRFDLKGLIGTESLAVSDILRDPTTGRIIGAISDLINGPDVVTDGIDFAASYDWRALGGGFTATIDGTFLNKYDLKIPATATAPARVYHAGGFYNTRSAGALGSPVSIGSFPKLKINTTLTATFGKHSLTALARYIGSYDIHPSVADCCNVGAIDDDLRFDLFYTIRLFGDRTRLTVGVLNLTDVDPPLAPQELGYDTSTHSFMTRSAKVSLSHRF